MNNFRSLFNWVTGGSVKGDTPVQALNFHPVNVRPGAFEVPGAQGFEAPEFNRMLNIGSPTIMRGVAFDYNRNGMTHL